MFKNIFFSSIKLIFILKTDIGSACKTVLISLIIVQVIVIEDGQL